MRKASNRVEPPPLGDGNELHPPVVHASWRGIAAISTTSVRSRPRGIPPRQVLSREDRDPAATKCASYLACERTARDAYTFSRTSVTVSAPAGSRSLRGHGSAPHRNRGSSPRGPFLSCCYMRSH